MIYHFTLSDNFVWKKNIKHPNTKFLPILNGQNNKLGAFLTGVFDKRDFYDFQIFSK